MSNLRKVNIDGFEIEVDGNMTVLQACELAQKEVPRFCYHERLSIAGNCRMCLVEIPGMPKPQASCALQVKDLRPGPNGEAPVVKTNSPVVKKAREGVMEFLLINHPLDCPICDQGGECDLQDQAMAYGVDFSRYREPKRAHEDINLGPLVKTAMTRCIHCTRCVRFTTEVAGITQMGSIGRGEDAEIVSYLNAALDSELSGNVIDLCPVGALTSKPYAFTARSWELKKTETIDVMDAMGAAIRVDTRGREVMRIVPRENAEINEEWISDKSRFVWDGLRRQRLDKPYIRGADGKLQPASWVDAFALVAGKLNAAEHVVTLAGDMAPAEAMFALKAMLPKASHECRQDGAQLPLTDRGAWLFNGKIAGIDQARQILLIGTNPRLENPVLNARLRKAWANGAEIALIGSHEVGANLTYPVTQLGTGPQALADFVKSSFAERLKADPNAMIILGAGAVARADGAAVLAHVRALAAEMGASFNLLQGAASRVAGMELGFATEGGLDAALSKPADIVWLLGADEIDMARLGKAFVIYQGSHGDAGAHRADVILPASAWTEENGLFVNMEGRVQLAHRAGFAPGDARENWAILRALSAHLGVVLPFDSLNDLRKAMFKAHMSLAVIGGFLPTSESVASVGGDLTASAFNSPVKDFWLTNPIARASVVMAELSRDAKARRMAAVAAE